MSAAGRMRESIRFQRYEEIDDGAGNYYGDYVDVTTVPARIRYLKGSEEVLAGRLTGVQPVEIRIRNSPDVAGVTTEWRAINDRAGNDQYGIPAETFNIRSIVKDERGAFIDLLVEKGTA